MAFRRRNEIAELIRAHGGELIVDWNAGGDETLVSLRGRDVAGVLRPLREDYERRGPLWKLREAIVDELELPNSGEQYHQGEGQVSLGPDGEVVLHFSSRDYCMTDDYGWQGEVESAVGDSGRLLSWDSSSEDEGRSDVLLGVDHVVEVPIENRHDAESLLHRARIFLVGEMDRDRNCRTQVRVEIINGDRATISDESTAYYEERIHDALSRCAGLFDRRSGPVGIAVQAQLRPGSVARFEVVTQAYHLLRIHNREEVTLMVTR